MGKKEELLKSLGGNMNESIGIRPAVHGEPPTKKSEQLRSFLDAATAKLCERIDAIRATMTKTKQRSRKRKANRK